MNTPVNLKLEKLLLDKDINMPVKATIADVIMWLYEKHGIWVAVNIAIDNKWYFELYNLKDTRNAEIFINDENITDFHNSPTEAYTAGIEYTLNNLI